MNFEKVQRKNRKAISPVLATVILIAITLIAAIAIAGFVFGLFGSFTSSATVTGSVTSCLRATSVCTLSLANTGTANTAVSQASIVWAGQTYVGTVAGGAFTATTVNGGASGVALVIDFTKAAPTLAANTATVGTRVTVSLLLTNGATVPVTGVWS